MVIFCPVKFDSMPECKSTIQKQKSNNTTFLCRNGHLLPCQIWFYARMVAFSPVKIQLYDRMVIFLHCQISSLSASLGHFPTSGLTGSRIIKPEWLSSPSILCRNDHLVPYQIQFYDWNVIFVHCQSSRLSLSHILTPLGHSTSNWVGQELYGGIINFRYQIWLYAEMVIFFSHIQIWFHTGMVIDLYSKNSSLSHILHLSDIPQLCGLSQEFNSKYFSTHCNAHWKLFSHKNGGPPTPPPPPLFFF